jgi:hypothetical protein
MQEVSSEHISKLKAVGYKELEQERNSYEQLGLESVDIYDSIKGLNELYGTLDIINETKVVRVVSDDDRVNMTIFNGRTIKEKCGYGFESILYKVKNTEKPEFHLVNPSDGKEYIVKPYTSSDNIDDYFDGDNEEFFKQAYDILADRVKDGCFFVNYKDEGFYCGYTMVDRNRGNIEKIFGSRYDRYDRDEEYIFSFELEEV